MTSAQSLPEVLDQLSGSVNVNSTQGNPSVVDLNYRGFTASPVLGTPQGIVGSNFAAVDLPPGATG